MQKRFHPTMIISMPVLNLVGIQILNHHMIYDNSSTHNLKQITRKTKIIVESLLQLIPIKTCQNGAKSVKHYSFFF